MKTKEEKGGWKPKRRGHIYCAPRCGGGCTWEAHQAAKRAAAILAKTLGKGWQPRVWENLGWHYEAIHPLGMSVREYSPTRYWATTLPSSSKGGRFPQHHVEGKSARGVVQNLISILRSTERQARRLAGTIEMALDHS